MVVYKKEEFENSTTDNSIHDNAIKHLETMNNVKSRLGGRDTSLKLSAKTVNKFKFVILIILLE